MKTLADYLDRYKTHVIKEGYFVGGVNELIKDLHQANLLDQIISVFKDEERWQQLQKYLTKQGYLPYQTKLWNRLNVGRKIQQQLELKENNHSITGKALFEAAQSEISLALGQKPKEEKEESAPTTEEKSSILREEKNPHFVFYSVHHQGMKNGIYPLFNDNYVLYQHRNLKDSLSYYVTAVFRATRADGHQSVYDININRFFDDYTLCNFVGLSFLIGWPDGRIVFGTYKDGIAYPHSSNVFSFEAANYQVVPKACSLALKRVQPLGEKYLLAVDKDNRLGFLDIETLNFSPQIVWEKKIGEIYHLHLLSENILFVGASNFVGLVKCESPDKPLEVLDGIALNPPVSNQVQRIYSGNQNGVKMVEVTGQKITHYHYRFISETHKLSATVSNVVQPALVTEASSSATAPAVISNGQQQENTLSQSSIRSMVNSLGNFLRTISSSVTPRRDNDLELSVIKKRNP